MKHLYKILTLLLLLAAAGGQQCGVAQSGTSSVIDTTICESFTWNNMIYTSSTDFTDMLENTAGGDSIVEIHLTVNQTTYGDTVASACESFTWCESTFYESGFYTHTYNSSTNYDSIVTLHLTIHHGTHNTDSASACGRYRWHGTTYTISGTYWYEYTNDDGCPSVDTLHLIINNPTHNSVSDTACEIYTWTDGTGETYTSSGTYLHPHEDDNGCTQVDTLHLTINHPVSVHFDTAICSSSLPFTWHDTIFAVGTVSGDYIFHRKTVQNCDSVVTLHITVNPLPTVIISGESNFCKGDNATLTASGASSYIWGNGATNRSITVNTDSQNTLTYTVTGTDANGCTKTASKTVTVNPTYNIPISASICQGDTLNFFGLFLTAAGSYTRTLYTSKGCDSVITLILTVNPLPNVTISGASSFCQGTSTMLTASGASTYAWSNGSTTNETTVNYAGYYTVTGTDANGCSDTATRIVTVNPIQYTSISESICQDATYDFHGRILDATGVYVDTLSSLLNGCDSIVTLTLIVKPKVYSEISVTACDSYTWNDSIYTSTGDYVQSFTGANGCDSVVTLHLTLFVSDSTEFSVTACESYTWNGTAFTGSGDFTQTFTNIHGCDSVVTLHLTIHHGTHNVVNVNACESYSWHAQNYTTSGTYTYSYTNEHGCPSVDTLHLVINPSPTPFIVGNSTICYDEEATLTAVGGETYQWSTEDVGNSIVVAMEGLYTVTATNMHGCSSTAEFIVNIAASPLAKKDIIGKSHADGSYYMLVYPEADLQYQWYKNNVVIEGATKQYYYPSDYTFEGSLDLDACYQVAVHSSDPDSCGIITDCWMPPTTRSAKIHILPNPNNGQFRLLLPEGTVSVQVLNANGQTVMTRKVNGVLVVDMTTNLTNGLYFVKTFRQDGSFNTEKLVINR